jgi:hypothetical protein
MPNIKFSYLYRDGANYKKFNAVIFKNDPPISIEELEILIKSKLIYGEWFYADQWELPEMFLDSFDHKIDLTWHEFESVGYTNESSNTSMDIQEFVNVLILLK